MAAEGSIAVQVLLSQHCAAQDLRLCSSDPAGGPELVYVDPSAPQSEEEGVAALGAVHRIVFIIEVQDVLLRFEAKLLVEQHGRITGRHVQSHVFAHTRLKNTETFSSEEVKHVVFLLSAHNKQQKMITEDYKQLCVFSTCMF